MFNIRNPGFKSLPLALLCIAACSKNKTNAADTAAVAVVAPDTSTAVAVTAAPGAPLSLAVATKPGVGVYLTDSAGRAVYVLDDGTGATIACTGTCATDFIPVAGKASKASGAKAVAEDLIGFTTLPDGTIQVTYAGKPLYYAASDQGPSTTTAQGKKEAKTTSYLVNPKGSEIKTRARS